MLTRIPGLEFSSDDRLFHYTSGAGLFGILESQCLWATHYRFLNDSQEFRAAKSSLIHHFTEVVRVQLARLKVSEGIIFEEDKSIISRKMAEQLVEIFYSAIWGSDEPSIRGVDGYIFSTFRCSPTETDMFRNGGLLHWATYGRDGGYAIQINPEKLEKILIEEGSFYEQLGWLSHPVVYSNDSVMPPELDAQYKAVGEVVHKIARANLLGQEWPEHQVRSTLYPLLVITCLLKNAYFTLEREARLVIFRGQEDVQGATFHNVLIRHSGGTAIPYISLFDRRLFGENCPVERIIVGPHADNQRRMLALNTLLRARRLTQIEVTQSNVPFVNFASG